jgi:Endonuclease-reverse transcriptase
VGELSPIIDDTAIPRRSRDKMTNNRAPWLIEVCEMHGLHILNGLNPGPIACNTFHRGNDSSCIDLILSNIATAKIECDPNTLKGLSDHTLVTTTLRTSSLIRNSADSNARDPQVIYKWVEGTGINNYASAANSWQAHTQTQEFVRGLQDLIDDETRSNDQRAAAVEDYLLK